MTVLYSFVGPNDGTVLWWQMTIRGVIIFLFCAILIRVLCRRAFGMHSYLDISLAVLVGSILSRSITGGGTPFLGPMAAATAMAVCYWCLIHLAQRFRFVGWLVKGAPLILVKDGKPIESAMATAAVSQADLDEAARQAHIPHLGLVQTAIMERSGHISIVRKD